MQTLLELQTPALPARPAQEGEPPLSLHLTIAFYLFLFFIFYTVFKGLHSIYSYYKTLSLFPMLYSTFLYVFLVLLKKKYILSSKN